ncbi:hypothetical protein FM21_16480 [Streptomyces mutabilis]|uniref:NADH-Ubiquinone oxidoreductase (complex I) chain 5 N-terminal domain-containing protein n=1 Tax=Streptomyces mutabilis TaxID=67332 RepID=A0A086MUD9_9ACTN|nr:hypothetical protein FM21_16480 [Streptomyces mutabilis]
MSALVLCHFALALFAAPLVRRCGTRAFLVLALPPAAAAVWAATRWSTTAAGGADTVEWIRLPAYRVDWALRLDALAELMVLLAAGVGTLVLMHCASYFDDRSRQLGRFAGNLLALPGRCWAWSSPTISFCCTSSGN